MNEFTIIKNYFTAHACPRADVILGIGDDAAVTLPPSDQCLAITTDTLVAGIHFPTETAAEDIGYKSLAVNLSDLAAMGAEPAWVTLSLTLPVFHEAWLQAFSRGFFELANQHRVALIGGDLTHGPLSITVQAMGFTPPGKALTRRGAKQGDLIYVSGTLGDAGLALALLQGPDCFATLTVTEKNAIRARLNRPQPRVELGLALRTYASAAIDISDGLAADLGHILEQSQVGALIHLDQIPLSNIMQSSLSKEDAISMALTAGDDYELCFTIPPSMRSEFENTCGKHGFSCIGSITSSKKLIIQDKNGAPYHGKIHGYQHF